MKKRQIIFSVALLIFLVFFIVPPSGAETIVVGFRGTGDYTSIQEAVDAAAPYDTILIRPAHYYERITIDKPLTLLADIQEGRRAVISQHLPESRPYFIINIKADSVVIKDLVIRPEHPIDLVYSGIIVNGAKNCRIENCKISVCGDGIWLRNTSGVEIINNKLPSNWGGIHLSNSKENLIQKNTLGEHAAVGAIFLENSHQNQIIYNHISSALENGIALYESNENIIIGNTLQDLFKYAIYISGSRNIIFANILFSNNRGLKLSTSFPGNRHPEFTPSGNIVAHNLIKQNSHEAVNILLSKKSSPPNVFYGNTIVDNELRNVASFPFPQVSIHWDSHSTEQWDSSSLVEPAYGNFWGQVEGYDGGTPYLSGKYLVYENPMVIDEPTGNVDNFPLVEDPNPLFIRGDANADGRVDLADAIRILNYLFLGQDIQYQVSADVNGDEILDLGDPIYLLNYLFVPGSPQPPEPFKEPGLVAVYDRSLWP